MALENLSGTSQQDALKRIAALRSPEPVSEPTEEPKAVNVSDDDTPEEVEAEAASQDEIETEAADSAELESEDGETATDLEDEPETLYVDIDGEEVTLDQLKEWKQGNLRQSDYTRKTQELADTRKALAAEKEQLSAIKQQLTDSLAEVQAQAALAEESIDWNELREYDPAEYLKQKELQDKRQALIAKAKGGTESLNSVEMQEKINSERQKLLEAHPQWLDKSGKVTDAYTQDMTLASDYLQREGYSEQEIGSLLSAHHWKTILKAAKFDAQSKKGSAIEKKVKKAPLMSKPKSQAKSNLDRQLQAAHNKMKQTGRIQDAQAYMKLKRQKGN